MTATSTVYPASLNKLLQGLSELRDRKLLCDVDLVAEDETFPVHRVVLPAASPYFQAMFTGGFKENELDVITLQETSAKGLKFVLDAIYTSNVTISNDTVENILSVAQLFQMDDIVKTCENYLCNNNTENNCVTFLLISKKYELNKAIDNSNAFIIENFEDLVKTTEFNKLSKDMFLQYVSDDKLKLPSGLEISKTPGDIMDVMR